MNAGHVRVATVGRDGGLRQTTDDCCGISSGASVEGDIVTRRARLLVAG